MPIEYINSVISTITPIQKHISNGIKFNPDFQGVKMSSNGEYILFSNRQTNYFTIGKRHQEYDSSNNLENEYYVFYAINQSVIQELVYNINPYNFSQYPVKIHDIYVNDEFTHLYYAMTNTNFYRLHYDEYDPNTTYNTNGTGTVSTTPYLYKILISDIITEITSYESSNTPTPINNRPVNNTPNPQTTSSSSSISIANNKVTSISIPASLTNSIKRIINRGNYYLISTVSSVQIAYSNDGTNFTQYTVDSNLIQPSYVTLYKNNIVYYTSGTYIVIIGF